MGRLIGGVVLGYVVMVIFVVVTFALMYPILGANRVFEPGSWAPSTTWAIGSVLLGLIGAMLGGMVCARVSRQAKGPKILAIVVLILGLAFAIPILTQSGATPAEPRPDALAMSEAMSNAQQPIWAALLNPLLGAIGVLIGGGMVAKRKAV
jgi:uncharacterized membrane protein YeaQ/YmgE (transglycosylase-associated protein family)